MGSGASQECASLVQRASETDLSIALGELSSENREKLREACRSVEQGGKAVSAPDALLNAWAQRKWITSVEMYPDAPSNVEELYKTHLAIQSHPSVEADFGGHGGYKIGAVGALGEVCIYAPLFRRWFVDAPDGALSISAVQMWQVEPEFGMLLGADLTTRADGEPHSVADVLAAVKSVVLCIECCGRRSSTDVASQLPPLGKFLDMLSAGGVVLGSRLPASQFDATSLASCAVSLAINGKTVGEGSGAACPGGGPAEALTWLANHLNSRGLALKTGHLVITGATCITKDFKAGDKLIADFVGLGSVETVLQP